MTAVMRALRKAFEGASKSGNSVPGGRLARPLQKPERWQQSVDPPTPLKPYFPGRRGQCVHSAGEPCSPPLGPRGGDIRRRTLTFFSSRMKSSTRVLTW